VSKSPASGRSLADLLPVKGEAARPEAVAFKSLGEAPQGPAPTAPPIPTKKVRPELRVPLTVKIRESIYLRLREAAHREDDLKQNLTDEALDMYLRSKGY